MATYTPIFGYSAYRDSALYRVEDKDKFDAVIEVLTKTINDLQRENKSLKARVTELEKDHRVNVFFSKAEYDKVVNENKGFKVQLDCLRNENNTLRSLVTDKNGIIAKQDKMLSDIMQIIKGKSFKL